MIKKSTIAFILCIIIFVLFLYTNMLAISNFHNDMNKAREYVVSNLGYPASGHDRITVINNACNNSIVASKYIDFALIGKYQYTTNRCRTQLINEMFLNI